MNNNDDLTLDIVCCVLAKARSRAVIDKVLSEFAPLHSEINCDYAFPPNDPDYVFCSADELVNYFVNNINVDQALFWNEGEENPDRVMVGAFFTNDGQLIMSLTIHGYFPEIDSYHQRLKSLLGSSISAISCWDPPEFENGADFSTRYGT